MKSPDFKLYYNPYDVVKRNKLINLCNGGRGTGKTFGYKYYTIKDFIDNKKECVWVRRTDTALQEMCTDNGFFKDIEGFFENEFTSDCRGGQVDGKTAVHFVPLSQASKFKSVAYPNVNKLIFDEYIIGAGDTSQRYLKNEVFLFLNLISTVFRDRDDFQVFLLGNFETVDNPYMEYFNIYPVRGQVYNSKNDVLVQQYENKEFENHMEGTRFGKLIKNTKFGDFAIKNKSLSDNEFNIKPFGKRMSFIYGFIIENVNIGFWEDEEGYLICSSKINNNGYVDVINDVNTLVSKFKYSKNKCIDVIKTAIAFDCLYFENILIKRKFIDKFDIVFR